MAGGGPVPGDRDGPCDVALLRRLLAERLGERWVSDRPADRTAYARDFWPRGLLRDVAGEPAPAQPDVVCWPADEAEVAAALAAASEAGAAVVPYGAGSGVCGGTWPLRRGLIIDVKRLRDLTYDPASHRVRAGAGWIGQHLEDALAVRGRTLGHFPSSIRCSTLGGWVAARSAGQLSSRYGKIEDMVRGLRVVCPDGRRLALSVDDAGADFISVVVGSEGALAVVTEAELVTHPAPEARDLAGWRLRDVVHGADCMRRIMQAGLRPAVLRLYDEFDTVLALGEHAEARHPGAGAGGREGSARRAAHALDWRRRALAFALDHPRLLNGANDLLPGGCLLITGFEGRRGLVAAEVAEAEVLLRGAGAEPLGPEPGERWLARRHSVSYKQPPTFAAGAWADTMEVATTWPGVVPLYEAVRAAAGRHVFVMAHFSHAYTDGCSIYFSFVGGPVGDRTAALARYDAAWDAALRTVAARGATISHHHGVGMSKAARLIDEHGPGGRRLFEVAKAWFDPSGRMNPGKLWAAAPPTSGGAPGPAGAAGRRGEPARVAAELSSFDRQALLVRCAPDARILALEAAANARGMTLGPFPAVETLAEALALPPAAWPCTPRYGTPRERVVAVRAVLPDGAVFEPTEAPRKAVGPDLVRLLLSARPPLARIERLTLRARPLPEARRWVRADREPAEAGVLPAVVRRDDAGVCVLVEGPARVVEAEAAALAPG